MYPVSDLYKTAIQEKRPLLYMVWEHYNGSRKKLSVCQ